MGSGSGPGDGSDSARLPIPVRPVSTEKAPAPSAAYSQALIAGGFIFVAGQRPEEPGTGHVPDGITAQSHLTLRNVSSVLAAAGAKLGDVVKVTVHLADIKYFREFNSVYAKYFETPFPVRTTVGSQLRDILVEVDVIALDPAGGERGTPSLTELAG